MLQSRISVIFSPTGRRSFKRLPETKTDEYSNADTDERSGSHEERPGLSLENVPWFGNRVPNGYWDLRENRVRYLAWLGEQCGFVKLSDWYRLRRHHFQQNNGGGLLRNSYGSSVLTAMLDFRPD